MKLVSNNLKKVKEFINKKPKEEHIYFLRRTIENCDRKLQELLSGEGVK